MHKDHKILIYTTTRVLTLIFLANAYAEGPMLDEDTMVYRSSAIAPTQFEQSDPLAGQNVSHVLSAKDELDGIDPKKSMQRIEPLEVVVEEELAIVTPQAQAVETAEILEEIASKTPVVRTVAGFTLDDVNEMAALATLSYTGTFDDEKGKVMVAKLKSEGWEVVEFSTKAERSGIVLVRNGEAIISYHGSESLRNFATDAYATMSEMEWASGYAHTGFLNGFEKTWDQVYGALNTHATKQGLSVRDMKVKVTGHSLGAALATLAAYRLATVSEVKPEVINFASPRVFDRNAAANYETLCRRTLRVVHKDSTTGVDPVALVGPGILGFKHIGTLFEIKDGGSVPHVMGGYHGALGNLNDDQFEATKSSGNGFFSWFNGWLYPVESDRHVAKGIVRVSHIAPDKWIEVQGMEPEEHKAFVDMRQASISLVRAIAANKSPETLAELNYQMLNARSYYEIVRDQHLDITAGVRKARHKVESKEKAFKEVLDKVERRQQELIDAVDYAEENFTSKKAQKEVEEKKQKLTKQKMKVEKAEEKLNAAKNTLAEKRAKAAHKKFGNAPITKETKVNVAVD
ncbi:MAG: hypothetical protein BGO76_04545 [Caedibacter sp. 38-128]|mgnify:CR=1 FL=1|nr:hypothetical protein [Holosporales bacterium]OJX04332.1 MAG: hypothetical protein BGO76_04545 [Caedibacter sp. 38-128]